MDTGLLIIRLLVGLLLAAHGLQKLSHLFGGHGIAGTTGFFRTLGYPAPAVFAVVAGLSELGGGLMLAVGFLSPLAAACVVGVMVNAYAAHWGKGFWATRGGGEYAFVLGVVAAGLGFTGPGGISLDGALGLDMSGAGWGIAAVVMGAAAAGGVLLLRRTDQEVSGTSAA